MKKKFSNVSLYQWCMRLMAKMKGINYGIEGFPKFDFPFQIDLKKQSDLEKIQRFIASPLQYFDGNLLPI